ncbi:hypothetical protein RJT34_32053 [Clitoria ternatea]|uniref:Uncharacterized protein n=1 Tax=Clitoria ternatea TaxID=43366 RepID=A0AAN9I459_CLITE
MSNCEYVRDFSLVRDFHLLNSGKWNSFYFLKNVIASFFTKAAACLPYSAPSRGSKSYTRHMIECLGTLIKLKLAIAGSFTSFGTAFQKVL